MVVCRPAALLESGQDLRPWWCAGPLLESEPVADRWPGVLDRFPLLESGPGGEGSPGS